MKTRHLVRPELLNFLDAFPIPEMNASRLAMMRETPPIPYATSPEVPDLAIEERFIPGINGAPKVRVLIYRPTRTGALQPAILHIHGGGFVLGTPEMCDASNRLQSAALHSVIVSVDYRLPPEHPFPGPLDDCYAALLWAHEHAAELGIDPERVAIKGESAGGGLAAGLALFARDRGQVSVAFQCLTYPMIDDRSVADPHPFTGEYVWSANSNRFGWSCYLGKELEAEVACYAAPARAVNLAGLPPTFIATAALDLFLEENLEYARRLTRAGVPVELIVYPGAYHGFHMAGDTAICRRCERDIREALREGLRI